MTGLGKIEIPCPTPSGNKIRRMHRQAYRRLRNKLTVMVRLQASGLIPKCEVGEFRTVIVERRGPRTLDLDNLVWGAKPLVDAIRLVGLIEDDSPGCVDLHYRQTKASGNDSCTVIEIIRGAYPQDKHPRGANSDTPRLPGSAADAFCEIGHDKPIFGCIFCILAARGLDEWGCCDVTWGPDVPWCQVCGEDRPERFRKSSALIDEAESLRRCRDD